MKRIIALLLFIKVAAFACTGDCASCHFNIDFNDKNHSVMLNCKVCHTDEKLSKIEMQSSCGEDCFACHNIAKVNAVPNPEHEALNTCISCHTSLKDTLRGKFNNNLRPLFNNKTLNNKSFPK